MDNEELEGVKFSEFPSQTPGNSDEVVGLHSGDNARFSIANIVAAVRQGLANIFVPKTDVGVADGVASLDSNGKVPGTQLDLSGKQATITASGILKGDGAGGVSAASPGTDYQAPLTIDSTPTASSTNPVQSGGVYADVRTRVPVYGMGKNLLDNGNFIVNQRNVTSGSASSATYVRDRWIVNLCSYTFNNDGSVTYAKNTSNYAFLLQYTSHELRKWIVGKKVTISAVVDGAIQSVTITMPANWNSWTLGGGITVRIYTNYYGDASKERYEFQFYHSNTSGIRFGPVMVELGEESTLGHVENGTVVLNSAPDYEYERYRCITSTADSTDTYANKSLATEQQLAYVETGTTASRNYTAGQYISLNGLLYTADTAIANGATFYTSGGNKNLTECVGGGFNNVNNKKSIISTSVIFEISGRTAVFRSKGNGATSTDIRNALIPQIYRPSSDVTVPFAYYNGSTWVNDGRCIGINSSTGAVVIVSLSGGIDTSLSFNFSTFCATWIF